MLYSGLTGRKRNVQMRLIYSRTSFPQNMCLDIRAASRERTAISLDFPIYFIFLYPMPYIIGYLHWIVTTTKLSSFSRFPWRHPRPLPLLYNVEWTPGQPVTENKIDMGGGGGGGTRGIIAHTMGTWRVVTVVGQFPNNFVQDCICRRRRMPDTF